MKLDWVCLLGYTLLAANGLLVLCLSWGNNPLVAVAVVGLILIQFGILAWRSKDLPT